MKLINNNQKTEKKNYYWLINLRWIAISGLALMILLSFLVSFKIQFFGLLLVLAGLIIHNLISALLLKKSISSQKKNLISYIHKIIFYQIVIDLLLLTILIHFLGGFVTPLLLFYTFHIVLASILLSRRISYLIAFIEVILLITLVVLEYYKIIPYHTTDLFDYSTLNIKFVLFVLLIFTATSFVLVYLVSNIALKLKKHEKLLYNTNKKLERANSELERKDSIKDEYVLRVTHDIKGHLAAIQTNLSVLHKQIAGPLDEKQMKFVTITYNRTLKLTNFVKDLLRITNIRLNNKTEKEDFIFNDIINNVIETVSQNAINKNIEITLSVNDNVKGYGNKFSIEEVISNLILNAIKYTPENGVVNVFAKNKGEYAEIIIEDTGIGIPQNEINNVFDDFYRCSNVKNKKIEGTGLGLSLVWQNVERNNGKIWVKSKENEGSKFIFSIPSNRRFQK